MTFMNMKNLFMPIYDFLYTLTVCLLLESLLPFVAIVKNRLLKSIVVSV